MAIDHEQRRAAIAEITVDLMAREGLEAATIRRIAAEAGYSTASVTHYFVDKQELLCWAFQYLSEHGERQFEAALRRSPGDPLEPLKTLVPWCAANRRRWKAYLAFWDQGARDPELADLLARSADIGLSSVTGLLEVACGRNPSLDAAAELLHAMVQGLALKILAGPSHWPEGRIEDSLRAAFALACRHARQRADA